MILSSQTINIIRPLYPFVAKKQIRNGMSYGLSSAGYDVRHSGTVTISPGEFTLGGTLEYFYMPDNICGFVKDKSSWARRGLSTFNTFIDPGFKGFLTLEFKNLGEEYITIEDEDPICQIIFAYLDEMTEQPYVSKYQYQQQGPQEWIKELPVPPTMLQLSA